MNGADGGNALKKALTGKALEQLFDGKIPELQEPFFRENGKLFMHFDRIDVEQNQLVWYWRGKVIVSQPLDGLRSAMDPVTISGIEGKTEVTFTRD